MNMRGISGKWNAMWHSSPSPKYGRTSAGHWFASASSMRSGYLASSAARMRFSTTCVSSRFSQFVPSRSIRYGTASSRRPSTPRSSQNPITLITASSTRRVVEVQVGLMVEEPVPVIRLGRVVPAPVRRLGVGEDDPHALVLLIRVAPHVEVALRRARRRPARRLEPRMLIGGVIDDELGDDADPAAMRLGDEPIEILERAVARMDVLVVRDVVPVVAERRRVERQQPETVDPEPLEVLQLLREAGEVADAVVGAVEERADVRLIDDGVLVPQRIVRIGHRRVRRSGHGMVQRHVQDVRDAALRIEPHVVPFAAPEVALAGQQVEDLDASRGT